MIRHQRHAAARAFAGRFGAHVAIHGAGELDGLLRAPQRRHEQAQQNHAAHAIRPFGSNGQTAVVVYPPSTAMIWPVM